MEVSQQISGAHTTVSPCGRFIASIAGGKLRIHATHAPERFTEINIRIQPKDVSTLRWNDASNCVAVLSSRLIEVVDLHDDRHRIRLDNGSGGLGKFTSADFIGSDQLLVVWEFGKAKVWDLASGRGVDLADVKTACAGNACQTRPQDANATTPIVASISRIGADDHLNLYSPALHRVITSTKLPTTDVQDLSWSPDGRWLAVMDTPTVSAGVHFYTPDGHLFRSYPTLSDTNTAGLGVKAIAWAGSSRTVALTRFNGKLDLLNTRTFNPLAVIEHHTIISQPDDQQAPIWQEVVSAAAERSYTALLQPFSPPLSRTKTTSEPSELGVAEACFSADGSHLATRDQRMLNTVWVWNTSSLAAHTVLVQHSNVRKMQWHHSKGDCLLLDCGEAVAYTFCASTPQFPPSTLSTSLPGSPALSWLPSPTAESSAVPVILCTTKTAFQILYPEGRPEPETNASAQPEHHQSANAPKAFEIATEDSAQEEDEDSLLDLLAGRTPLPQSYTERVDLEVETDEADSTTMGMDDTFRGRGVFSRDAGRRDLREDKRDPLDDSDIF